MGIDIILKEITEADFNNSKEQLLFESEGVNRKFALIGNDSLRYIISWQSDLFSPNMVTLTQCHTAIGIDQNFSIVDFCKAEVLVKMKLTFNFVNLIPVKDKLLVLTELEFFELEAGNYNIVNTGLLPDILDEVILQGEFVDLKCVDGRVVKLAI